VFVVDGDRLGPVNSLKKINKPNTMRVRISSLEVNHRYRFYVWGRTESGRGESAYVNVRTASEESE
jgi:hypothetical protein